MSSRQAKPARDACRQVAARPSHLLRQDWRDRLTALEPWNPGTLETIRESKHVFWRVWVVCDGVTYVHSLQMYRWRDRCIGRQAVGSLEEVEVEVQAHDWP